MEDPAGRSEAPDDGAQGRHVEAGEDAYQPTGSEVARKGPFRHDGAVSELARRSLVLSLGWPTISSATIASQFDRKTVKSTVPALADGVSVNPAPVFALTVTNTGLAGSMFTV